MSQIVELDLASRDKISDAQMFVTDVCWDRLSTELREAICCRNINLKVVETSIGRQAYLDKIMCRPIRKNIEMLAFVDFLTSEDGMSEFLENGAPVVIVREPNAKWDLLDLPFNVKCGDLANVIDHTYTDA